MNDVWALFRVISVAHTERDVIISRSHVVSVVQQNDDDDDPLTEIWCEGGKAYLVRMSCEQVAKRFQEYVFGESTVAK